MRELIFTVIQIVLSILLMVAILLQQKGSGIGVAFGGGSTVYSTKRGIDQFLYRATIVLACLFFGIALLRAILL